MVRVKDYLFFPAKIFVVYILCLSVLQFFKGAFSKVKECQKLQEDNKLNVMFLLIDNGFFSKFIKKRNISYYIIQYFFQLMDTSYLRALLSLLASS